MVGNRGIVAAMTPAELVDAFLESKAAAGLSPKSIKDTYATPLKVYLLPFLAKHKITDLTDLDQRMLDKLNVQLMAGGARGPLARESVRGYLRHINFFLKYAATHGSQSKAKAQLPKKERKEVLVLTPEEIQAMEDAAPTERDKVIIHLASRTGIRLGELVGIRVGDIREDGRHHHIRVKGKTGERFVPIQPALYRRLMKLCGERRGTAKVFMTLARRDGAYEPLTNAGAYGAIKQAAWRAGITKRVYPHLLRKTMITKAIARGMNAVAVSEIMGVSLDVIASNYNKPTMEDRHEALRKMWEEE